MDIFLYFFLIILSILIGIVIGLMAQSGSVIIIPFLFSFFFIPMLKSMGTSLLNDFISATVASIIYFYYRAKNDLDIKLSIILGGIAFILSILGSFLAFIIVKSTEKIFPIFFALFQIIIGVLLIRNASKSGKTNEKLKTNSKVKEFIDDLSNNVKIIILLIFTCIAGINSGLFAGGGGFLMTVLLLVIKRYEIHKAVGTGVIFMAINSLGPSIFYSVIAPSLFPPKLSFSTNSIFSFISNLYVDFNLLIIIVSFSVIGSLFGSIKAQKISEKNLKYTLGLIVLILNSIMLVQAIFLAMI